MGNKKRSKVEYYSNLMIKKSIPEQLYIMMFSVIEFKELIIRFLRRDITVRYKQSILGLLWVFIIPVISILFFVVLNKSGVMNLEKVNIPYPLYAIVGITCWQLFSNSLMYSINALVGAGGMIAKINFPKSTLIFAAIGRAFVEFLIRCVMIIAVAMYYQYIPSWKIIFVPLVIISLILFSTALGFLFSILNCIFRDIGNVIQLIMTFCMFVTPVLYPIKKGALQILNQYNPLNYFINGIRDLAFGLNTVPISSVMIVCGLSVLLFIILWRLFIIVEPRIAERI